jgi:hypothetical protein
MSDIVTQPTADEIMDMATRADIPPGANFAEAYQRLRGLAKLEDAEADRWAHLITGEAIPEAAHPGT